jgi:hypothetical protein
MQLSESREHVFGEFGTARMNAFAHLRREGISTSAQMNAEIMLQGLLFAVAHFAQGPFLQVYDARIHKLEVDALETRTQLQAVCRYLQLPERTGTRAAARQLTPYLSVIRIAFEESFGTMPDLVVTERDDSERPIELIVDASKATADVVSRARASGARGKFYDAVLSQLPADLLDAIEFQFVFPTK